MANEAKNEKHDVSRLLKSTIQGALSRKMADFDYAIETDYDEMSVSISVTSKLGKPIGGGGAKETPAKQG